MQNALTIYNYAGSNIEAIGTPDGIALSDDQIGMALGYAHPSEAISKIVQRNADELAGLATQVNLTSVEGGRDVNRSIRVWGQQGIIAITFLAKTKNAMDFRKWARETLFPVSGIQSGNHLVKSLGMSPRAGQRITFAQDVVNAVTTQIQAAIAAGDSELVVDHLARTLVTESKELALAYRAAHKLSPNYRRGA